MSNRKRKNNNSIEPLKIWFWSLIGIFVFCLFSYGYCVRGAIVNIVTRQNMESELSLLDSKVIQLESEYIKVKNSITSELAQGLGFIEASNQKFVTRKVKNPGLSFVAPSI